MNGTDYSSYEAISPTIQDPNWQIIGQGDFDGDGKVDILWRNSETGQTLVWLMDGTTFLSFQSVSPTITDRNWNIVGVGDFNGDAKPDILWRNYGTGQQIVWLMNGTNLDYYKLLAPPITDAAWNIVGPK
jgi:hypothetical protein